MRSTDSVASHRALSSDGPRFAAGSSRVHDSRSNTITRFKNPSHWPEITDPTQLDELFDAERASLWGYFVYGAPALITDAPPRQRVGRALLKWLDA